jgi:tRNA G18 (ribose-2'-O)-methylase SpoU
MTARPLAVGPRLRARERCATGGPGSEVPRLPLAVLVDNVRSLWNVGSIFRTADACGVSELVLTGITGCPPQPRIAKTALGAERAVAWSYRADPLQALDGLLRLGYTAVALETSARARSVECFEWPERTCLVVGNEVAGVTPRLLDSCEHHVAIPMLGVKESLNVAVAFGIVAHDASRALRLRAGWERPVAECSP